MAWEGKLEKIKYWRERVRFLEDEVGSRNSLGRGESG